MVVTRVAVGGPWPARFPHRQRCLHSLLTCITCNCCGRHPSRSRLLHYGEEHMEEVRRRFMEAYPDPAAPLRHTPAARLVCLRRLPAAAL
jgi:hypothetical protein